MTGLSDEPKIPELTGSLEMTGDQLCRVIHPHVEVMCQ